MGDIISRKEFVERVARPVEEALKMCPDDAFICEKCYKIMHKDQVETNQKSRGLYRFYCWCDYNSPDQNYN